SGEVYLQVVFIFLLDQPGLSFISPDVPTESNFDSLLKEFGGNSFNTEIEAHNAVGPSVARNATKYEYGSPILTAVTSLKLPAPLGASACTDTNPVGKTCVGFITIAR
ncbi:hypothetical protein FKM82_024429, partial [Ascaphus truei]